MDMSNYDDDHQTLDIIEWKRMVKNMLVNGWKTSDEFLEWVAECALHSFEDGDIDDDVCELLLANEQWWLDNFVHREPFPNE